jgi:glycosidase
MSQWLKDAVFYEIYPQSFNDTNADGIGDIPGIIEKLEYIQDMGFNAIWLNPCFDSSFVDAGYDVRDFYKVAERYGTNEDLKHLFEEAHKRDMHVIIDLVAGHTSNENQWFKESCKPEKNAYTDRYIWSDTVWNAPNGIGSIAGWYRGGYDRDGAVAVNFFTAQAALNYGFYNKDEGQDWQEGMNDEGPLSTREDLKNIMRFWLGLGCDGFRVDMAGSLVKNDPEGKGTIALWKDVSGFLKKEFPEAVMVSEWGEPDKALEGGFDMDFLLHFGPSHYPDLFRTDHPYFSSKGEGDLKQFWELYQINYKKAHDNGGLICIPSGNHDMDRMAKTLSVEEMKIAFAFLLSMPGAPFVYYGDEIGMRYVEVPHSVEGGYFRTGSRSPMQWDTSTNAGFSSAKKDKLYIKQDEEMMKNINVEIESSDENSLLHEVSDLIEIRKEHKALGNYSEFKLLSYEGYPLIYERKSEDEKILVVINPKNEDVQTDINLTGDIIYSYNGNSIDGNTIPACSAFFIQKES